MQINSRGNNYRVVNVLDRALRGWLPVKSFDGKFFELPYLTKVSTRSQKKYLQAVEGINKFEIAYIDFQRISPRFFSRYIDADTVHKAMLITVLLDRKILRYQHPEKGMQELAIEVSELPRGHYSILVPDRRHQEKTKKEYLVESKGGSRFAETWFPIKKEENESRYLHFGSFSLGCVTVLLNGKNDWNQLYLSLISSRNMDGEIGKLHVI